MGESPSTIGHFLSDRSDDERRIVVTDHHDMHEFLQMFGAFEYIPPLRTEVEFEERLEEISTTYSVGRWLKISNRND